MADLGGKFDDVGALSALGELAEQQQDARGMLHLGKAALARGLPLDYYAFPAVGVPRYSPIGPGIDNAMLFAIIRQESAFDPADWSHAQAMGLMQVTPIAAKDTCKRFSCSYDVKRLKNDMPYNLQVGAAELGGLMQDYRGNYILSYAGLQCRARPRAGMDREVRRSARPQGRSGRLGRAHSVHGNPQLRAACDGEHAGLSDALRRRAAHDRDGPAPGSLIRGSALNSRRTVESARRQRAAPLISPAALDRGLPMTVGFAALRPTLRVGA